MMFVSTKMQLSRKLHPVIDSCCRLHYTNALLTDKTQKKILRIDTYAHDMTHSHTRCIGSSACIQETRM